MSLSTSITLSSSLHSPKRPRRFVSSNQKSAGISKHLPIHPSPLALQKTPSFPIKIQSLRPNLPFHPPPTPSLPRILCAISPAFQTSPRERCASVLKSCAGKLSLLVLGSVLFMGSLRCRPALASVPAAPLEEKIVTPQKVDSGDEEGYLKVLERNPRDVEALKMVLYGKMRKGKTAEAVKYVERLIDVEADEVEWRLLQALSYELMGQLGKAKRLFKDILEERPLLIRALHGLALVMHKNHEGLAVFEMLSKALELARREQRVTEERNIQILIAQMHVVKGDLAGGLEQFQNLANENPRDFRPFLCQGIIYSLLDKKKEADEQFEIYRGLVPEEFPQRGFLDDVILAAKTESQEQLQKEFDSEFSYKK